MDKINKRYQAKLFQKIRQLFRSMSLRRSIRWIFGITFFSVCTLSAVTVYQIDRIQEHILQKKEFFTDPDDGSYQREPFTTTEAAVYDACYAAMAILPAGWLALGMTVSSRVFYRLKLQKPLAELTQGISRIAADDLDFTISYEGRDDLGLLCMSMERMRRELCANNKKMWDLFHKQNLLHASVAHDLRTPITVLRGYLDFFKDIITDLSVSDTHTPGGGESDKLLNNSDQEILAAISGMDEAVSRMEQYVVRMQDINQLENVKVRKQSENVAILVEELKRDICHLGVRNSFNASHNFSKDLPSVHDPYSDTGQPEQKNIKICVSCHITQTKLNTDKALLFRIIENLVQNAVRYAKSTVTVRLMTDGNVLTICAEDDGSGFRSNDLEHATDLFYTSESGRHFGIGLNICSIICDKLGGTLSIKNRIAGGACVTATVKID